MKNNKTRALKALVIKGFAAVSSLLSTMLIIQSFSPQISSSALTTLSLMFVASVIFRFGSDQMIVRKAARFNNDSGKNFAKYINLLVVLVSIGTLSIAIIINNLLGSKISDLTIFYIFVSTCFYSLTQVNSYYLQGKNKISLHLFFLNLGFNLLLSFYLKATIFLEHNIEYSYENFTAILTITCITLYILSLINCRLFFPRNISRLRIERTIKINSNYHLFSSVQIILVWLPQLGLYFLGNSDEVAEFTLMHRISLIVGFVLISVTSIYTPIFANNIRSNNKNELEKNAHNLIVMSTTASLFFCVSLFFTIGYFFKLLDYSDYLRYDILTILFFGQIINSATGPSLKLLQMGNEIRTARKIQTRVFLFALIATLPLIITLNSIGAALLCCMIVSVANIMYSIYALKIYNIWPYYIRKYRK